MEVSIKGQREAMLARHVCNGGGPENLSSLSERHLCQRCHLVYCDLVIAIVS